MTGLDTNVLVRYLVQDDPIQTRRASHMIDDAIANGGTLFVADVVVCELVWVLDYSYRFSRKDISAVLAALLRARQIEFEDPDLLWAALRTYENGRGDFADYLIREKAAAAGCASVATFDRALLKERGFVPP